MVFRIAQFLVGIYLKVFYPTKIVGKKNIPKGAAILSCNHTSNFDAILIATNTWEKKYYLTKKEWFKNKLIGWFMKKIGCIKIDRQSTDITAVKNCLKVLKDGKKLFIFPEGTRNKSEDLSLGQVKQGVSMFAIKAKVPVVPMYISSRPKFCHRTIITVGEPFELSEFYGQKTNEEVLEKASEIVAENMKSLQEQVVLADAEKKARKRKKDMKKAQQ